MLTRQQRAHLRVVGIGIAMYLVLAAVLNLGVVRLSPSVLGDPWLSRVYALALMLIWFVPGYWAARYQGRNGLRYGVVIGASGEFVVLLVTSLAHGDLYGLASVLYRMASAGILCALAGAVGELHARYR